MDGFVPGGVFFGREAPSFDVFVLDRDANAYPQGLKAVLALPKRGEFLKGDTAFGEIPSRAVIDPIGQGFALFLLEILREYGKGVFCDQKRGLFIMPPVTGEQFDAIGGCWDADPLGWVRRTAREVKSFKEALVEEKRGPF